MNCAPFVVCFVLLCTLCGVRRASCVVCVLHVVYYVMGCTSCVMCEVCCMLCVVICVAFRVLYDAFDV